MTHEIKLLKIHKRNAEHLRKQKARFGLHCPTHIKNQLDAEKESIDDLEKTIRRRLQSLLEKAAMQGISADPAITIEIEDIQGYFNEVDSAATVEYV